jgi:plastocyanin
VYRHNDSGILLWAAIAALQALPAAAEPSIAGSVTGADGKGIAHAVVFVLTSAPPSTSQTSPQVVDQVGKAFVPELLPIVVGTLVRFPNHDQIHHHVYSFSPAKTFELPLYKGEDAAPVLFDKVGVVKIGCNIHDWMSGIILVLPTPYFAVTGADGRFILRNLPAGSYTVSAWHALSKLKPEDSAQPVQVSQDVAQVAFTLSLSAARPRRAMHGARVEP